MFQRIIDTPLGQMLAIGDAEALCLLEFVDQCDLDRAIKKLCIPKSAITFGNTDAIISIENELKAYFSSLLTEFHTPYRLMGTSFQRLAWSAIVQIPYGKTRSYLEQAKTIDKAFAYRAVANANGANRLAIMIPCHRIIRSNGDLGGYAGGVWRKKWLIEHERSIKH